MGLISTLHHHRPNGGSRTSDLLSGIRRNNVSYIKEEINPAEIGYQTAHDYDGSYSMQQPTPQELERMANAETPPALSNVEITSSILASLSRDSVLVKFHELFNLLCLFSLRLVFNISNHHRPISLYTKCLDNNSNHI